MGVPRIPREIYQPHSLLRIETTDLDNVGLSDGQTPIHAVFNRLVGLEGKLVWKELILDPRPNLLIFTG